MNDTFYIGAYWQNRKRMLDDLINPTLQTLLDLYSVDEQFLNLFELGMSQNEALKHDVLLTAESIKRLYNENFNKKDLDQDGFNKIGYRLSLWTGHLEGEASAISFNTGSSSKVLTDSCLINIPYKGHANDRLLQLNNVKKIMSILIRNWDPEVVVLNSKELYTALNTTNEIGWVTYINKKKIIKLNNKAIEREDFFGGDLFYLKTGNSFSYNYDQINSLLYLKKLLCY